MGSFVLLHDITPDDSSLGGKARGLIHLAPQFKVPEGFVIPGADPIVTDELLDAFDRLGVSRVAVRSSAVHEDGTNAAWAGQLDTLLNIDRDGLASAVAACRNSASSERAMAYAKQVGVEAGPVAVIVQTMLEPRLSGVAFSRHPVTGEGAVVIEVVEGLGEALVSGRVTPDTYIVSSDKKAEIHLSGDNPLMTDKEIDEVSELTTNVEQTLGFPVDIEWAYQNDELFVLQARPITAL